MSEPVIRLPKPRLIQALVIERHWDIVRICDRLVARANRRRRRAAAEEPTA